MDTGNRKPTPTWSELIDKARSSGPGPVDVCPAVMNEVRSTGIPSSTPSPVSLLGAVDSLFEWVALKPALAVAAVLAVSLGYAAVRQIEILNLINSLII